MSTAVEDLSKYRLVWESLFGSGLLQSTSRARAALSAYKSIYGQEFLWSALVENLVLDGGEATIVGGQGGGNGSRNKGQEPPVL